MISWKLIEPYGLIELEEDELEQWAKSGRLLPTSVLEHPNGSRWQAKDLTWLFSTKSLFLAIILSLFAGLFGADRFYLGKTRSALLKLFLLGGLGLWWIFDLVQIVRGKTTDKFGRVLI